MTVDMMFQPDLATFVVGDRDWLQAAIALAVVGAIVILWLNRNRLVNSGWSAIFRVLGWLILAVCLINPLWSSSRPKSGANVLAVITDTSRSHQVAEVAKGPTRADRYAVLLEDGERREPNGWLNRLGQDFELRRYVVTDRLRQVDQFGKPEFEGRASSLNTALTQIRERFEGQPLAGIVLLSDGNATDFGEVPISLEGMPPIFPVVIEDTNQQPDLAVQDVLVTQTAFDDAPVTVQVVSRASHAEQHQIRTELLDQNGVVLETQTRSVDDDSPSRFTHRPTEAGTVFIRSEWRC